MLSQMALISQPCRPSTHSLTSVDKQILIKHPSSSLFNMLLKMGDDFNLFHNIFLSSQMSYTHTCSSSHGSHTLHRFGTGV